MTDPADGAQMDHAKPLPTWLAQRYHGWKATTHAENASWYLRLAEEGQRPRTMVVSCCDSRVHVTSIFGAEQGEFFIHRNIAALVPPYKPDGDLHGTSAAIEYAVTSLKVTNLIVMGHSRCGGVEGCRKMCAGEAPELEKTSSFVGRWMDLLRPGYTRLAEEGEVGQTELEREAVLTSLRNLMTFPFVAGAVEAGTLSLHGLWTDIASGELLGYMPGSEGFEPV